MALWSRSNLSYESFPKLLPPYRVSVIDDDIDFLDFLQTYLDRLGYGSHSFKAPISPEDLKRALDSDLILVDLFMPRFDGLEFLREATSNNASPPIIMMTGHTEYLYGIYQRASKTLGAVQMIAKTELVTHLPEILARHIPVPAKD